MSFIDDLNAQEAEINAKDAAAAGAGELVGRFYREQIADGYAYYEVVKATKKTVTLQHIDFCDGYRIPLVEQMGCKLPRHVVAGQIAQREKWDAMFTDSYNRNDR